MRSTAWDDPHSAPCDSKEATVADRPLRTFDYGLRPSAQDAALGGQLISNTPISLGCIQSKLWKHPERSTAHEIHCVP